MAQTILIIEDEEAIRTVLSDALKKESFSVLEADNGVQGLNMALEKHPNLILLDIIMPVMDGVTLLKKLREDEWGKSVEVIMLTNLSDAHDVADALSRGVHDFLVKADWKLEDLIGVVKQKLKLNLS